MRGKKGEEMEKEHDPKEIFQLPPTRSSFPDRENADRTKAWWSWSSSLLSDIGRGGPLSIDISDLMVSVEDIGWCYGKSSQ